MGEILYACFSTLQSKHEGLPGRFGPQVLPSCRNRARDMRKRSRAGMPPGCDRKSGSGGPRAGVASEWFGCLGGATRARTRNSPDDVRIRQAVTASDATLDKGRARGMSCVVSGTKHRPRKGNDLRHRPVSAFSARIAQGQETGRITGGRLNPILIGEDRERRRSHAGFRLPSRFAARHGKPREAFLPPGPIRSRSIRQRECGEYGTGVEGVEKVVEITGLTILVTYGRRTEVQGTNLRSPWLAR